MLYAGCCTAHVACLLELLVYLFVMVEEALEKLDTQSRI